MKQKIILLLLLSIAILGGGLMTSRNAVAATQKNYGYSKTELREVVFYITDTKYYSAIIAAQASVCGLHFYGSANPQNMSAQAAISSNLSAFYSLTSNSAALYGMVDSYYSNALTAQYGTLKTSFLKDIGIGAQVDITYNTILRNANIFLSKIRYITPNENKFAILFHSKVYPWTTRKYYYCQISRYSTTRIQKLETNFAIPRSRYVNFYSLTSHLIHNIYFPVSSQNKRISEKLFSDIILEKWHSAEKLFQSITP